MAANYSNGTIGYDLTFELNEFNEPRIRSEIETLKDVVLFILLSKPGQYPSLPQIGMDIESLLYTYADDDIDEDDIKNELIEQCSILGAYINAGSVDLLITKWDEKPAIMINIEGTEEFPPGYKHDQIGDSNRYLIGLAYDEFNNMIVNVNNDSDD